MRIQRHVSSRRRSGEGSCASSSTARSHAGCAGSRNPCIPKKPWNRPSTRSRAVSTPAASSFSAYASPWSRSGSYSAVTTNAGGSPCRSTAQRRQAPVLAVGRRARVVLEEPAHVVGLEAVPDRVVDHRRVRELEVGDRIHEQLELGRRAAAPRARRGRPRRRGCRPRCRRRARRGRDRRRARARASRPMSTRRRSRRGRRGTSPPARGGSRPTRRSRRRLRSAAGRGCRGCRGCRGPNRRRGTTRRSGRSAAPEGRYTRTGISPAGPGIVRPSTANSGCVGMMPTAPFILARTCAGVVSGPSSRPASLNNGRIASALGCSGTSLLSGSTSASASARNARPRCESACFSAALISANVRPSPSTGTNTGS